MCNDSNIPKRAKEWIDFSKGTYEHVIDYTIPQYGDEGEDRFTSMTSDEINQDIKKHAFRLGKNQRGIQEQLRDYKKLAHESCVAYHKLLKEIDIADK